MKYLKLVMLFWCVIGLAGCLDNTGTEPTEITEPAGSADFYINNQSDTSLNIVYRISGARTDSVKAIAKNASTKFLRDGIFGGNPSPARSLDKIAFYKGDPNTSTAIFIIDPVEDEPWKIAEEKGFEDSDYGFRVYELMITEEDID